MKTFLKVAIAFVAIVAAGFIFGYTDVEACTAFICNPHFDGEMFTSGVSGVSFAMAMPAVSGDRARAIFRSLQKKFNPDPKNPQFIIEPSYLRIEKTLTNNSGTYTFDIKKVGGEKVTEQKLDRNDVFVVTDLGIYLLNETSASVGLDPLQTYPNATAFPDDTTNFLGAHLETLYAGKFKMKIGTRENISALSMQVFRNVPTTQKSAASNNTEHNIKDSAYELGSLLYLYGNQDINVSIDVPVFSGIKWANTASGRNSVVVFHPFGYLIKGAAAGR